MSEPEAKKQKAFSITDFRQNLYGNYKISYLQHFLKLCAENKHNYILEYLESGGNCSEILQVLQNDPNAPPTLIFEIISYVLLEIVARHPNLHHIELKTCNLLLNQQITTINKMLSTTSKPSERKIILKLLTTIVSFSPNLAKDVLIHVNFNATNIKLLTKPPQDSEKDSVRKAFLNFLCAFLVDGRYPTISAILGKSALLTSVINGLRFDPVENVCVFLSALKSYVLENPSVSKTTKMKVFTTQVIRDIVNFYNWKGPKGITGEEKANQLEKSKLSECVHDFLLTLCTTKHGVIFKDPELGFGKTFHNNLILTVIDSLERPWDHSYASELVIKICGACPDLAKSVWSNLSDSLKPRDTENWLKAVQFAKKLIDELQPQKILKEEIVKNFNVPQLVRVTTSLNAPISAIKPLKSYLNEDEKKFEVMRNVFEVILSMLRGIDGYLSVLKNYLDLKIFLEFKKGLNEYIFGAFPAINIDFDENIDFSNVILNVLVIYKKLSPQLLVDLEIDEKVFDQSTSNVDSYQIKVKIIDLMLDRFDLNSPSFPRVLTLLLKAYYFLKDDETYRVISQLFLKTNLFDLNSQYEIDIWINSIFNSKKCDDHLCEFINGILIKTSINCVEYTKKFVEINDLIENDFDLKRFLTNLDENSYKNTICHNQMSLLVFGLIDSLEDVDKKKSKSVKSYVNYLLINLLHQQTKPKIFLKYLIGIIRSEKIDLDEEIKNYFIDFDENLGKNFNFGVSKRCNLGCLSDVNKIFFDENLDLNDDFLDELTQNFLKRDVLHMLIFYVTNLYPKKLLKKKHLKKLQHLALKSEEFLLLVLKNVYFLDNFSILKSDSLNSFIFKLIEHGLKMGIKNFESLLESYQSIVLKDILVIIKTKNVEIDLENTMSIIKLFDLKREQCFSILTQINLDLTDFVTNEKSLSINYHLICFSLHTLWLKSKNYDSTDFILTQKDVNFLLELYVYLSEFNLDLSFLTTSLFNYLKLFPHLINNDEEFFLKLILKELTKENVSLICLFLEKNHQLIDILINNLEKINLTKSSLAIFDVLVKNKEKIDEIKIIYEKFEPMLLKSLEKPQKAGKYFEIHQIAIGKFIKTYLKPETAINFVLKINKYEIVDSFLSYTLNIIYQIAFKGDENNRFVSNSLLTFINLLWNVFKKDQELLKLDENVTNFNNFLHFLIENKKVVNTQQVLNNNLKTLIKFLLKFGLMNRPNLLNLLNNLIQLIEFPEEDLSNVMEMVTSHSEFMDLIILEGRIVQKYETKLELLKILQRLFQRNENLIEPSFVPLILSSYEATTSEADQILLGILKIFEEHPQKSNFYEYKPFLWGKAAANHYSVKSNIETSLFRQPKISTILDLIELEIVLNTIKYNGMPSNALNPRKPIYDLNFFLPLFSNLLLPENPIQPYRFTKSGALSLTILGLSSQDPHQRGTSCYVLSLFYTHLDAKRSRKDNLIWIRFIEAICKAISALTDDLNGDFELNNFVAVFLSRMALILTNSQHVMYPPLSQYLTAKSVLDFKLIPELLTLLHSPDVNYKEHRKFILQVIFDGLKTKRDFKAALNSISFKLILESFNSCLLDRECKMYVIKIVEKACKLDVGTKLLCENYGLFSWLYNYVENFGKENDFVSIILDIVSDIISFKEDYNQINEILICFINRLNSFNEENTIKLLKILCSLNKFRLKENMLRHIFNVLNNKECLYYLDHLQTIHLGDDRIENVDYYLKLLTSKWILSK